MLWLWLAVPGAASPTPPVVGEMHARYEALAAARDAVIRGSVPDAVAAMDPIAAPDVASPLPAVWRPMDDALIAAARRVAQARDVQSAAQRVTEVAVTCAACHAETGGGPAVDGAELPAQRWNEGQNMPLHRWSVDWMWLGLVSDSDEAWLRGARELDDHPLAPKFAGDSARAQQLEQRVYALAAQALTTEGNRARAAVMGELLTTCAACHAERGGGPR
ncbi:MAG: hypothetical protein R3F59_16050 [Myxococcota bacterium]